MEETINILGVNISKDIYSAVKRATSHLTGVNISNPQMNITENELKSLIEAKADKKDLMNLN